MLRKLAIRHAQVSIGANSLPFQRWLSRTTEASSADLTDRNAIFGVE
jgi:hypothetical protein